MSRQIAYRFKTFREAHGLSMNEIEVMAGIAHGALSRIESGSRGRQITVDVVVSLAQTCRIDLLWLITGHGRAPALTEQQLYEIRTYRALAPKTAATPRKKKIARKKRPSAR